MDGAVETFSVTGAKILNSSSLIKRLKCCSLQLPEGSCVFSKKGKGVHYKVSIFTEKSPSKQIPLALFILISIIF